MTTKKYSLAIDKSKGVFEGVTYTAALQIASVTGTESHFVVWY